MHNIEKSLSKKGQYVGYGDSRIFFIRKTNSSYGNWIACDTQSRPKDRLPDIYAFTLKSMSSKLEKIATDWMSKTI